jgi:hypothetical protein
MHDAAGTVGALAVGLLAFLLVIAIVAVKRRERQRMASLRGWAEASGWQWAQTPPKATVGYLSGAEGSPTLLLLGQLNGRDVAILEYHVTTRTKRDDDTWKTETEYYVATEVRLRQSLPAVTIERRGPVSRLGHSIFGSSTAVGNELFDRHYRVVAQDAQVARRVLRPEVQAAQIAEGLPYWSVEGTSLHTSRDGRIGAPASIPSQFTALLRLADQLDAADAAN